MIRVTVEVVPQGDQGFAKKIAGMQIINDGTGDHGKGNYNVYLYHDESFSGSSFGRVENWNRKRPVWDLIIEATRNVFTGVVDAMKLYEKEQDTLKETEKTDSKKA